MRYVKRIGQFIAPSTTAATSFQIPVTAAASVGNSVIIVMGSRASARILTAVSDSKGNTYQIDYAVSSTNLIGIARSIITNALASGDTITVTQSGSNIRNMGAAYEFSGLTSDAPQSFAANGAGGTPSIGIGPATVANSLMICAAWYSTTNSTPPQDIVRLDPPWRKLPPMLSSGASTTEAALFPFFRPVNDTRFVQATTLSTTTFTWRMAAVIYRTTGGNILLPVSQMFTA